MFSSFGPHIAAELADIRLTEPDLSYTDRLDIDLGGHTATLRTHGPAHTAGDQTVLIDERVLFTGDLVETRMFPITPYFPPHDTEVDPGRWITVLDDLIALDPAIVVPDPGEACRSSPARPTPGPTPSLDGRTLVL
jgi:glyoxylase-like metal-dependent hydrolase (beta-lactamase superfamily II)